MKKVEAFYNYNCGWAWACPVCNPKKYDGTFMPVAEAAEEGKPGVCSRCYPGILGRTMVEIRPGVRVPGIDDHMKADALEQATEDGRVYQIVFPKDKGKILAQLRKRNRENMNWIPGETVDDLIKENKDHGIT